MVLFIKTGTRSFTCRRLANFDYKEAIPSILVRLVYAHAPTTVCYEKKQFHVFLRSCIDVINNVPRLTQHLLTPVCNAAVMG